LVVVKVPYEVVAPSFIRASPATDRGRLAEKEGKYMRQRLMALAATATAVGLVLTACTSNPAEDEIAPGFQDCLDSPNTCNTGERRQGGQLIWTLDVPPTGYFPWSGTGGSVYTLQAMHGILPHTGGYLPDGTYEYNMDLLAAEPRLLSDDPLQTEWRIRPEAVWDDGSPITADDFIITWKMSTPADAGLCVGCKPRATDQVIDNIEGSDDGKTFTITYKDGVSNPEWFLEFNVDSIIGGVAPAHIATGLGLDINSPEDLGEYFTYLDTNPPTFSGGPWLIQEFDLDEQVVKVPNPNWYGAERPTLDQLVIQFVSEPDVWAQALQNNELHGGAPAGFSEDIVRELENMEGVRLYLHNGPSWEHLDVNLDNEWLSDVALRRAIFTAIDTAAIAERNFGGVYPDFRLRTNHIFSADSPYHQDHLAGTGQGSGDVEAARQILAAAGYEGYDGGAGSLSKDGQTLPAFRLRSTSSSPARVTSRELIQSYLAEIGLEVQIEPADNLGTTLDRQDYDLIQFGWSGSPDFFNNGQQFWETGGSSNFGNYSNPRVDDLIAQERQVATLEESADLHNQMMEIVVEDAYVLPLYDSPVYVFVTDDYVNVRDNSNTSLRALYQHHEWGLAAE
jgi:peptide/nickel transport system substrate-binding protein